MGKHSGPFERAPKGEQTGLCAHADSSFKLGFWQLLAYSSGGMIGSGWLLGSVLSAQTAGGLAWISWLLGGAAMIVIVIVMMELGRRLDRDGGLVWWPFYSGGPIVAMVVTAAIWIFYALNPASEAAAAVEFASNWLPWLYSHDRLTWFGVGASAFLVILLTGLSLLGFRLITKITLLAMIFKVAIPLLVVGLLMRSGIGEPARGTTYPVPPGFGKALTAITSGSVIYTYIGFQAPVDFGGRARHPSRDIPWAMITPVLCGVVLFTLLQVLAAHSGLIGPKWHGIRYNSPYTHVAAGLAGWGLLVRWLVRIDTIVSPLGSGLVFTTALANTIDNISSQGLIAGIIPARTGHPSLAQKRPRDHRMPRRVLAINLAVSLLFLPFLPDWRDLVGASSVITVFVYAVPSISLAALVANPATVTEGVVGKNRPPSRRVGRYLAPLSFMLMTLILSWATFKVLALGMSLTLVGAAILLTFFRPVFWRKRHGRSALNPLRQEWLDSRVPAGALIGYFCGLVALCWLRQYVFSRATALMWGDVLALALGFFAFRCLVASSAKYMLQHPLRKGTTPDTPVPGTPPAISEEDVPPASRPVNA